jgi:VanZ family protein
LSSTLVHEPVLATPQRRLSAWIPTLIWLCVLALFSTDTFSAEHTGMVLSRILHALFGPISAHQFQHIHFLIRKSAHFGSYGLLSALAFFSWRATLPARSLWTFRWSALALLLTVTAAGLDEFHQSFLPSRTSSLRDVFLDLAGAIFFQLVILLWLRWRQARQSE